MKTERRNLIKNSVYISTLSMFFGCFIYLFLRPTESYAVSFLINNLKSLEILRSYTSAYIYPDWFLYSFPNGLWIFSYSLIILSVWLEKNTKESLLWLLTISIVGLSYEILQYAEIITGTFCLTDILHSLFGMLFSFIIIKIKLKREEKE